MMKPRHLPAPRSRLVAAVLVVFALGGCAGFSRDGGFSAVEQSTRERIGKDIAWARTDAGRDTVEARVTQLLTRPLSVDDAVQIALLNNKGLQARFHELGISEANLVQAGRLPNPGFSFGRMERGTEVEWERGLHLNLARLFAMPLLSQMEERRFAQVQREVTLDVLRLAADTRKAYFVAVAGVESVRYMRQVKAAAEASAELARRMVRAGNWSTLNQAREQGFYADAALNVARAELAAVGAREQLTRLMGLWGAQIQFTLPERLPDLPKTADELPDIEQLAMAQRLDLQALRMQTEALAKNLGLSKATRFVNVLELGLVRNTSNQEPTQRGYEIRFEIPLFDWSGARVAKAEAIYMQAVSRVAETAVNARSEVRQAYRGYRINYDIARHYRDEIVPVRKRISDENLLRYNGMLIGVFDLLADARAQIASVNGYIEALRDFWLAQSDLQMSLIGKPAMNAAPVAAVAGQQAAAGH
jgi:outer membrane protein TolC